jgi:transcriptional regulator
MLVHPWDAPFDDEEVFTFVSAQGFGHLIAPGALGQRTLPVVVPTQYLLAVDHSDAGLRTGVEVLLHLARPNPVWAAIDENPTVLLSVAGDWAYVPSAWKAVGEEDPALGIPTTYYAAAQLVCTAHVVDDQEGKLEILRSQLSAYEPTRNYADPSVHRRRLAGIRGLRLGVREVIGKFKYGGNVDAVHRLAVVRRLEQRNGAGDAAARRHLLAALQRGQVAPPTLDGP